MTAQYIKNIIVKTTLKIPALAQAISAMVLPKIFVCSSAKLVTTVT